ncbi:hypothetical protein LLB_0328 [Legionella longbeachae D-4968]|nr:hypothetical protein LLB_0328 [Legionella longbeachae D-4968]
MRVIVEVLWHIPAAGLSQQAFKNHNSKPGYNQLRLVLPHQ